MYYLSVTWSFVNRLVTDFTLDWGRCGGWRRWRRGSAASLLALRLSPESVGISLTTTILKEVTGVCRLVIVVLLFGAVTRSYDSRQRAQV